MPSQRQNPLQARAAGLEQVDAIVAISSCKGGVGKSTVACNLAYTLAREGRAVGLFDADVYGPSLPTLVHIDDPQLMQRDGLIQPLDHEGVKLMSFGYLPKRSESEAAIMRGPMVSQIINQLLTGTEWGRLDYLVIDMPPGTGDVALTLTQIIPITAALIVTTPQQLSFIDVVKGIHMFDTVHVPTVGVIENMAWFQPEPGGKKYYLFGQGARRKLIEQYGFKHAFEVPVQPRIAEWSDRGRPIVLEDPDGETAVVFTEIARALEQEVQDLKSGRAAKPELAFEEGRGFILTLANGEVYELDPVALRLHCRCAACVQEFSGEQLVKREDIPDDIHPLEIGTMGNYAVTVAWSHAGHKSIYPYRALEEMAAELEPVVNVKETFEV